jgi:cold shock protein
VLTTFYSILCLPSRRAVFRSRRDYARPLHYRERHTDMRNTHMAKGTVKWFNTTKGFGFIAPDNGGKDVFVHISAVERAGLTGLADNQKVTFDVEAGRDGRESASNLALA